MRIPTHVVWYVRRTSHEALWGSLEEPCCNDTSHYLRPSWQKACPRTEPDAGKCACWLTLSSPLSTQAPGSHPVFRQLMAHLGCSHEAESGLQASPCSFPQPPELIPEVLKVRCVLSLFSRVMCALHTHFTWRVQVGTGAGEHEVLLDRHFDLPPAIYGNNCHICGIHFHVENLIIIYILFLKL